MVHFKKYAPSVELKDYIQFYFVLEAGHANAPLTEQDFLKNHSQGTFDLMFGVSGGLEMMNRKKEVYELCKIFIIGHQEGFFGLRFKPDTHVVGVVFYPESFSKLFNFPLNEIANGGRILDDELSQDYQDIHEQLGECSDDMSCVQLLNSFFSEQLSKVDFSFTKFDQLIKSIRLDKGVMGINEMASQSNLSTRSLQRKMKQLLGVGPKSYSNVMRIKHVLTYIHEHPKADWQDILFNFGYYDQAHFIKDFKRYTGVTPSTFVEGSQELSHHFLNKGKR